MKKKTKLLILSLIASFALTGAMTACNMTGNTSSSESSVESLVESSESLVESSESVVESSSSAESSEESSVESSESPTTPEYSFGEEVEVITITMAEAETVMQFESKTLSARVSGTDETPVWTSSNPAVATVDENGEVLALSIGEAVITATIGDVSASCTVTVVATNVTHTINFSISSVNIYQGLSGSVEASISYKGVPVDGDFTYTWTLLEGEADVVAMENGENGKTATFTGLKPGTVTYSVVTMARGYETRAQITVNVLKNENTLGCANEHIVPIVGGYTLGLTLGDEATDRLTIGQIYAVENGRPQEDALVDVAWEDTDSVVVEDGVIIAKKAGITTLTGTATYKGEELSINLTVNVSKAYRQLADHFTIEVQATKTLKIPDGVLETDIEKVWINDSNVIFDKAEGIGSKSGKYIVPDKNGMPSKMKDLGKGQKLTIETNIAYYEMTADVYTMVINTADELNQWQMVAADNAVKAGVALEEQKKAIYSGYFILGNDIEYNNVWKPILEHGDIWAVLTETAAIGSTVVGKPGAVFEDWGKGAGAGFKGIFDGQGYAINGLETSGLYSSFIVTIGVGGIIRNVAFTNAKVGAGSSLLVDRGQGTVENVYLEIDQFMDGPESEKPTWPFFRKLASAERYVKNVLIDYTDCHMTSPKNMFLGCDVITAALEGLYVVGIDNSVDVNFATVAPDAKSDHCGIYENIGQLLADASQADTLAEWKESDMWVMTESLVLPKSVAAKNGGDISFTNAKTEVNRNGSLELTTDKDARYIVYSLKEDYEHITLDGGVVSVALDAQQGSTFTVVATSLIDGKTAEKEFTVGRILNKYTAATIDVELGLHVVGLEVVLGESCDVDISEIFATFNGQQTIVKANGTVIFEGVIDSNTFTLDLSVFKLSYVGYAELVFSCSTEADDFEYTLPLNVIQNNIELNSTNIPDRDTLQKVLTSYLGGNYVLTSDLDMGGQYLFSIATFAGVLDGQGHAIKNAALSYQGDKTGESSYNAHFVEKNVGTIKDIRFEINGMDYHKGSSLKALFARNEGTISNVYLNINLDHSRAFRSFEKHNWVGLLNRENAGTINNCIVNVTANEKAPVYDEDENGNKGAGNNVIAEEDLVVGEKAIGAITYNNETGATVANCYVITNGLLVEAIVLENQKEFVGEALDAVNSMKVASWSELSAKLDFSAKDGWSSYWSKAANGAVSFGSAEIFDNLENSFDKTRYFADLSSGSFTVKSADFKVGATWTVVINDVPTTVTVEKDGELTATFSGLAVGATYTIKCKSGEKAINFTNVLAITKFITTAEELKALGVGGKADNSSGMMNSGVAGQDITGYYVLAGDIDCEGAVFAAGYSHQKSFFKGTFDGNGHTVSNFIASSGGIFGGLQGATIKSVNFAGVTIDANTNYGNSYGNYAALLSHYADNTVFEDITAQYTAFSWRSGNNLYSEGLLVSGYISKNSKLINVTLDASGLEVECALSHKFLSTTCMNVVVKAGTVVAIGYTDGESGAAMTEWPAGITFEEVPAENA